MYNIAVTGYYDTGSSAVLDFLEEYENVSIVPIDKETADYEHVLFYYAGGLFDLCNQLCHGNTVMGSDAAINNFIDSMNHLNFNKFKWFGTYQNMLGDKFLAITNEFINSISVPFDGRNCNHCIGMKLSLPRTIKKTAKSMLHRRFEDTRVYNYVYDKKNVYLSMPTNEEILEAARQYTKAYMDLFPVKEGSDYRVFDHLIWPQQINEFADYFDSNLKIIVVQRDVRDMYIKNKYLLSKPYFPTDMDAFVNLYPRIVKNNINHPNAIIVQFEDMIYKYEEMEKSLEESIGLNPAKHVVKKKLFNPDASIENTQVFECNKKWKEESDSLSKALPEFVYDFPYKRIPDLQKFFLR